MMPKLGRATSMLALAMGMTAVPAAAQVGTPDPSIGQAEAEVAQAPAADIVVTGSLIRGTPEDAALPVDVIGAEELARQGNPSPVELLKQLPTSSGVLGDSNQFDSRSQGSTGVATVNLRALSPQRTLVLLNSHRLASAGNGTPSVDVNALPQAAIGRIEVLKDGAAATYGSDAVAGVVNFITRTDQEGFLAFGSFKYVEDTDHDYEASLSYGHRGDGYRLLVAAGFQKRGELLARERDFAIRPYEENPQGGWTGGGNPANFIALGPTGAPVTVTGPTGRPGTILPDGACTSVGGFLGTPKAGYPFGQCQTQYTPYDGLVELEKRYQGFIDFSADVADGVTLQTTALYARTEVPHGLTSPSYITTQGPSLASGAISASGYYVPNSNPGLVAYRAANPGTPAGIGVLFPTLLVRPFLAGGNPLFYNDTQNSGSSRGSTYTDRIRLTAYVDGPLLGDITYNFGVTYDEVRRETDGYDTFGDRFQRALLGFGGYNCTGTTPGANGCEYFNPFGNAYPVNVATGAVNSQNNGPANSADLASWIFQRSATTVDTELFVADGQISGPLPITLPGGDVQFGVGAQYRKNWFKTQLGANNNIAVTPCRDTPVTGNQDPTRCSRSPGAPAGTFALPNGAFTFLGTGQERDLNGDIYAFFGEVQVPVFDSLNLQLAARYEDYGGGVGSTFDPQIRARWQITPWLAVRGGYGTTFRGPILANLDPGRVTALSLIGSTYKPQDVFGNPNLMPESSKNYSGGVLLEFGGFNFSADYFRYELSDAIITDPLSPMVATLFPTGQPNTCAANPTLAARFQFTGGACTATSVIADITRVRTEVQNGPNILNQGLDFIANYRNSDLFNTGLRFGAGVTATYTLEYSIGAVQVAGVQVASGYDGVGLLNFQQTLYPIPEWKGQGFVEFGDEMLNTRITVNYQDGLHDQRSDNNSGPFAPNDNLGGTTIRTGADLSSYTTVDYSLAVTLPFDATISATVFNLFDKYPPLAREDYNYDPFVGNPYGRMYKISLSKKF